MELGDITVESLTPARLACQPFSAAFFKSFQQYDSKMDARLKRAKARGAVLRHVGSLAAEDARAEIQELPLEHPFANTKGAIRSSRSPHTIIRLLR